ncbi:MAG: hypothetical protein Q9164_007175 [Protoblastenia rupestris]
MSSATSFYDFKPKDKKGQPYDLSQLRNKVVLVVNTASKCGFTPQFEGLEKLYKNVANEGAYKDQFVILGFPCNQFGNQDPVRQPPILPDPLHAANISLSSPYIQSCSPPLITARIPAMIHLY